ncbi:metalloprotease [Myxococcus fulvus]|uniref:metalloprotease n=1 Tax=Myxococcus fulvus TaxID=33 RepID=UPI003B9A4BBD
MKPLFHVARTPVHLQPLFFLTALATGWDFAAEPGRLAMWLPVVFASVLLHELAHAWALRRFGSPASITLHELGGTTRGSDRLTHRQSAWVSLAGPAASLLVGGLAWAASGLASPGEQPGPGGALLQQLLWANAGWGLFNLLPVRPLDGGDFVASLVRHRAGYRHERSLQVVGVLTAVALVVGAIATRTVWMGVLALMLGFTNGRRLLQRQREARLKPIAPPRRPLAREGSTEGAIPLDALLGRKPAAAGTPSSTEPGPERARSSLRGVARDEHAPDVPHDVGSVGQLLFDSGMADLAVRPLQESFTREPSSRAAHALVLALLEAGRTTELESLLSGPQASLLSEPTLAAVDARAQVLGNAALTDRVTALRRGRAPKSDERG